MRWVYVPLLLLVGCAGAVEQEASEHPTVVSLNPCADAILAAVTAPGQLLAISHYSHNPHTSSIPPEAAARYPSTGGTVEEVLALAPDVVVADTFLAPATLAALEDAGVQVFRIGIASSLSDSIAQVRKLAVLAGQPASGERMVEEITARWSQARRDAPPVSTLLWQEGGIVAGEGSLAFAMLEQAGFASHSAARGLGQGAYVPLEQVLADPPQLILAAGDERMLAHPVLQGLEGVRYETFDSALLYCGGPTIPRALARLVEIRAGLQ